MSTNHHKREDPLVDMGYEIRDVDLPKLKKSVVIFFGFAAFSAVLGAFFLNIIDPHYFKGESGYQNPPKRVPQDPYPRLQTNATAKTDLMVMRQKDEGHLSATGYLDPNRTKVFIPIDRAIDLLAERGISKVNPVEAKSKGTVDDKINITTGESAEAALARMNEQESAAVKKYGDLGNSAAPTGGGN
jgi:hypothetical protein